MGLDGSVVQRHQGADQGQADAEPSLGPVERAVSLPEELEDAGQDESGAMPMPLSLTRKATGSGPGPRRWH